MKNTTIKIMFLILLPVLVVFFYACATTPSIAVKHPVEATGFPVCSECHTEGYRAALDHNNNFITRHRFYGAQNRNDCRVCHNESFCSDCHAHKEELKPSEKYKESPLRSLPHRGDYLNQHKIDGRINPASCFPCHGRQNNERCKACHR